MHGRSPVAAFSFTLALVGAVALPAGAHAQQPTTLDQAAASVDFPVFKITRVGARMRERTFTVIDHAGDSACPKGSMSVIADYRPRRPPTSRWIGVEQSSKPCNRGATGGKKVRRVRVLGRRVTIRRYCAGARLDCQLHPRADGSYEAKFWLRSGGKRTQIILSAAARVGMRGVVRALRSLRLVDMTRPVVALNHFRSPDGRILCSMYDYDEPDGRYTFCATGGGPSSPDPNRSARLSPDGTVELCDQDPFGCIQQWDAAAPLLAAGQTSRFGRFRCTEQAGAITCEVADGTHAGAGFRIDPAGVVAFSP